MSDELSCELEKHLQRIFKEKCYTDSTGKKIFTGDRVRFRGKEYTIKEIVPSKDGKENEIFFKEKQHTREVATEISIDLVKNKNLR